MLVAQPALVALARSRDRSRGRETDAHARGRRRRAADGRGGWWCAAAQSQPAPDCCAGSSGFDFADDAGASATARDRRRTGWPGRGGVRRVRGPVTTTLIDQTAFGGQAGTSSRIENYLGFPAGLSGAETHRAGRPAGRKFGVRMRQAARAVSLTTENGRHRIDLDTGEWVTAKSVIIATGRGTPASMSTGSADFEGVGIYYAATQMEAQACAGRPGRDRRRRQLGRAGRLVPGPHLRHRALIIRGGETRGVDVALPDRPDRAAPAHRGDDPYRGHRVDRHDQLRAIELTNNQTGQAWTLLSGALFVFVGARPSTDWLDGQLGRDEHGFVLTGADLPGGARWAGRPRWCWKRARRASSASAMPAAGRSSGSPPRSARDRWRSGSSSTG